MDTLFDKIQWTTKFSAMIFLRTNSKLIMGKFYVASEFIWQLLLISWIRCLNKYFIWEFWNLRKMLYVHIYLKVTSNMYTGVDLVILYWLTSLEIYPRNCFLLFVPVRVRHCDQILDVLCYHHQYFSLVLVFVWRNQLSQSIYTFHRKLSQRKLVPYQLVLDSVSEKLIFVLLEKTNLR